MGVALGLAGLAGLAVTAPAPAFAQQAAAPAPAGGTVQLDTVDVTAPAAQTATGPINGYVATESAAGTKTSAPLNRTPQAIQVVGAQQIEDQRAQTVDEATRYSPGIHSQTFGDDPRNDWFLIRGFAEQNTGYYLDGLQLFSTSFATFKLEPWNLERIEIVRGPSAVLYGGGDPGGLINAVSKMPTFTNFGVVEAGVNQYGNAYGAVDVGGVAGDKNQWAYRLVSIGRAGGTQVDHTDEDRAFVAPSLSYRPDGATTFTILGQYQHDFTNGQNFLPYQGTVTPAPYGRIPTSLFTSEPSLDTFGRDQSMIGYRFETAINPFLTLRQNVRYDHLTVDYETLYGGGYATPPTPTDAELSRFNFVTKPVADEVEADNQAEFHFDTWALNHTVLTGLDYKHDTIDDRQNFVLGTPLDLLNPVYTPTVPAATPFVRTTDTQDQLGFYGQDQVRFGGLTVVGAVREDLVDTTIDNRLTNTNVETNPTATSGKIGAIYTFSNGLAPYVSYATSFNPILGTNSTTGAGFVPETGELEEVGVKYQSPDVPFTAGVALFNLTRSNVLTTDPDNVLTSIQTGQQRSQGLELNAEATLADGLKAIGAFTTYDLEVTRDLNSAIIGKVPTNTPETFGSLWLDYTLGDGVFRGLGAGAGVRATGPSYADEMNTLKVPTYVLGDAAIHYDRDHWRAALNVSNIADTTYVGSCSSEDACFYGDRRKVTFSLAYRW